jgi:segregation and condensation protein A
MTGSTIQAIPRPRDLGGGEPFVVDLERFSGPLDLLLHLIRSQDIDIFDIPIARITDQFQAALDEGIDKLDLDKAGEFLEMAATLVRIKAQLLLPRSGEIDIGVVDFMEVARRAFERAAARIHRAPLRGVSVAEKITLVRQLLRKGKRLAFTKLFEPWGTRQHAVAALLASLELARRQVIRLEQVRAFGSIFLLRGKRVTDIAEEES